MIAILSTILSVGVLGVVALLTGLRALTFWRARRAEADYPPLGQFVTVEGVRLHYLRCDCTPCNGPPSHTIVLLHGSDGFLQDFAPTFELLASDSDHDVIAFDRPGHGYSEAPEGETLTSLVQARLIRGALRQLGVELPLLVGHSWSASLLMVYGLDYPDEVAGLVMLGGWLYPSPYAYPLLNLPQIPLLGDLLSSTLLILVKGALIRGNLWVAFHPDPVPPEYARLAEALWQRWPWQTRIFAQENTADRAVLRALRPRYASLTVPLVLVTGDSDRVVPPNRHSRRLHAELPASTLIVLPQTGHELPKTRPNEVRDAINQCHQMATSHQQQVTSNLQHQTPNAPTPTNTPNTQRPTPNAQHPTPNAQRPTPNAQYPRIPSIPTNTPNTQHPTPNAPSLSHARDLVLRYGWNATAYQILNPNIDLWFSGDGNAVVGYVTRNRVRVVAGAPVCEASRLPAVMGEFEQVASQQGERVCYFCAAARVREALAYLPAHSTVVIGAQPVWNPGRWPHILQQNASLRQQVNRVRNKGVTVSEWPTEQARDHPGLQRCLDEWMETHPLPPLHFLTESVSLDRLDDRRIFVAEQAGAPVGFLILMPVPDRVGWLTEQIVRGTSAPNGTPAALIDTMMRTVGAEGSQYVTLGLAPLSRRFLSAPGAGAANVSRPLPSSPSSERKIRLLLAWVRAHGRRFYNFDGLDAFKAKFRPDHWEALYAISNESRFSVHTLYAIAAAFSADPPPIAIGRALMAAVRQELTWARKRDRH